MSLFNMHPPSCNLCEQVYGSTPARKMNEKKTFLPSRADQAEQQCPSHRITPVPSVGSSRLPPLTACSSGTTKGVGWGLLCPGSSFLRGEVAHVNEVSSGSSSLRLPFLSTPLCQEPLPTKNENPQSVGVPATPPCQAVLVH